MRPQIYRKITKAPMPDWYSIFENFKLDAQRVEISFVLTEDNFSELSELDNFSTIYRALELTDYKISHIEIKKNSMKEHDLTYQQLYNTLMMQVIKQFSQYIEKQIIEFWIGSKRNDIHFWLGVNDENGNIGRICYPENVNGEAFFNQLK